MKTEQEIFDIVYKGIIAQGGFSLTDGGCVYRAPNGRKCAAGHLLPDEAYHPGLEGMSWASVVRRHPSLAAIGSVDFVMHLQSIHDTAADSPYPVDLTYWREKMDNLANRVGLSIPNLPEAP
jgi:hypothetical protein